MTKRSDTWMPLYIGDYLADTSRLTTEQHGAYLLLLMDYWRNGPPPDDEDTLAAIAKLPVSAWRKCAPRLRPFFAVEDGQWHQKRMDAEREKAAGIGGKRKAAGAAGAAKRWGKGDGKPIANAMANGMANGMANASQSDACAGTPSPSPIPGTIERDSTTVDAYESGALDPGEVGLVSPPSDAQRASRIALAQGLIAAGMPPTSVSASSPHVIAMAAAGVTPDEAADVVRSSPGKGVAYVAAAVAGRRADAQRIGIGPPAAAAAPQETAYQRRMREQWDALCPGLAAPAPAPAAPQRPAHTVIDMGDADVVDSEPRRLA